MAKEKIKRKIYIVYALLFIAFSLAAFFGIFFICDYKAKYEFQKYGAQVEGTVKDYYFRNGICEYVLVYEYKTAENAYHCIKIFENNLPKEERKAWCDGQIGKSVDLAFYKDKCMLYEDLREKDYVKAFYCACVAAAVGTAGGVAFASLTIASMMGVKKLGKG